MDTTVCPPPTPVTRLLWSPLVQTNFNALGLYFRKIVRIQLWKRVWAALGSRFRKTARSSAVEDLAFNVMHVKFIVVSVGGNKKYGLVAQPPGSLAT